jgi:Major Facilitator Superfamily
MAAHETHAAADPAATAGAAAYPRRWLAAVVMIGAALMDMIDLTVVNVALPTIRRDLGASGTELEWVVSAYMLAFAAVLIIAGSFGDLFGRKRVFLAGIAGFEDPGYRPPWRLLASLGARVTGVPVDDQGLVVDAIPAGTRLVYVTPSHQFPLGMTMPLPRRLALLDWAERHDAAIVEDDYDSEFRYGDRPIEPLQTLDTSGRVIYIGSFSKTMLPTLRAGSLPTPRWPGSPARPSPPPTWPAPPAGSAAGPR